MRKLVFLLALLSPLPAQAEKLLCLGTYPGFMMQIDGGEVLFDYLGDGTYELDPPLENRVFGFSSHALVTKQERWPVFIQDRACPTKWKTLPISVEIAVPTSAGQQPLTACCLIRSTP